MTREFQFLMKLIAAGAKGTGITDADTEGLDWNRVFQLAREQTADSLAAYGLKLSPYLPCPEKLRQYLTADIRQKSVSNYIRKKGIFELLQKMEDAGIHAVLLKGYSIAGCYAADECRLSADTDIWVIPSDEQKASAFLEENGFEVKPRWKNGHHAVCFHPELGCLELHVILYDEIVEDIWFNKMDGHEFVLEPHLYVETPDGAYHTLGYTDHLIFLTLHMIKHFILSGMSLRMMCDVALYFSHYRDLIDTERFWDTINSLHYGTLLNTILWGMIEYCGFTADMFPGIGDVGQYPIDTVLTDLEAGGAMGCNDKNERYNAWYEYNRLVMLKKKNRLQYYGYMLRWKWNLHYKKIFPTKEILAKHFPYVNKHPLLIPIAWLHRMLTRGTRFFFSGKAAQTFLVDCEKISNVGKQRIDMFRRLDIM